MAAVTWHYVCNRWVVFVAQIETVLCSFREQLQSDVSCGTSVDDNVASTKEEQIAVPAQFQGSSDVNRDVGTAGAFFGELPNKPLNGSLTGQQRL